MSTIGNDQDSIRQYLLGLLNEEQRERLEERMMVDREYREEVLIVEEELLEDYLDNNLSAENKQRLLSHWRSTPEQDRRLEIAEALGRHCSNALPAYPDPVVIPSPVPVQKEREIAEVKHHYRRAVLYAVAAVFLVMVMGGLWLLFYRGKAGRDFNEELTYLNRDSSAKKPDLTFVLPPLALRDKGATLPMISAPLGSQIIELWLTLAPDEHKSYQVALKSLATSNQYIISDLEVDLRSAGRGIPLKVPGAVLTPGDYLVEVSGVTTDGRLESVADYSFRVTN